ncbi:MAG: tetratricopeptide repeat protein [Gammaproteobacteria bacterium]|nr:tetratricopeptide repeat protein [Gammaproteobacteria bacterium]
MVVRLTTVFLIASLASGWLQASLVPDPKERVEYWRQNYTELNPAKDRRAVQAQVIFERILNAAGSRLGVHPRLLLIKEDPLNITLPVSIPDGWVIVSESVLDLCYQRPTNAEDKLAFVLAHEIAHLLDDDFWHINFFNAIDISRSKGVSSESVLNQIKGIIGEADKVAAKELRADEKGVLFASMAGFNVGAVIGKDPKDNFFKEWERLLDVSRVASEPLDKDTHPTSAQRTAGVLARLQQVSDQAELFHLGLLFYQSGNFEGAIAAFEEFLRHYPGREVHHNLAVSHHQLALSYLTTSTDKQSDIPFKMSLTIDPITRASGSVFRGPQENRRRFEQHIATAIEYYEAAIKQDPSYLLAYKNLASAYVSNNEPFKAIALLKDAMKYTPNDAVLLNVLGVAFYNAENVEKAVEYLTQARKQDPDYADPLFNLGKVEYSRNNKSLAKNYWRQYMQLDSNSNWVKLLQAKYQLGGTENNSHGLVTQKNEMLAGIQVGNYTDEVPNEWGRPSKTQFPLKNTRHTTLRFKNGITTITEGEEIRVLLAEAGYRGKTKNGVKIGDGQQKVIDAYGMPTMDLTTTQGSSLVYVNEGITFQLRDNKVVAWVVY